MMEPSPAVLHERDLSTARNLARRVARLPEASMRVDAVARTLREGAAADGVRWLEGLIRDALGRHPDSVQAYYAVLDPDPYLGRVGEERLRELLEAGIHGGCIAAVQWLRGLVYEEPPRESIDPNRLVHWGLREMTLGDRRALARRARGDVLTQLVVDPDGGVIRNLLNNPRTTEQIVLRICTRRPQVTEPLREVLRAPRWIQRYGVKRSLVRNPYLELRFALNLLVCLRQPDLREVWQDESLSGILRLGAQRVMDLGERAGSFPS